MTTTSMSADDGSLFATLNGIPAIDFPSNLQTALSGGRRMSSILSEVIALRRGPGKLTPNEYFYYRLWEPHLSKEDKRRFVGKQAQQPMHIACNNTGWYATAADKLLFHTLLTGAGLPTPTLLAVTGPDRWLPHGQLLRDETAIAASLRDPDNYPLFGKPIDGKYSISVVSADAYDRAADKVVMLGGETVSPEALAGTMTGRQAGYIIQRRMAADRSLEAQFGPRLWSVRVLVLLTPNGPLIHKALAKIATGQNPADNFWRKGNMLGAIELETGTIMRTVRGTGAEMVVNPMHTDTGRMVLGSVIPEWSRLVAMVGDAARLLPAIRTQSWDIALTDTGPVPLEVNFGGDLNLTQLASGVGMLDDTYREHLQTCGYRI
jgi:hypothetical protein